MGMYVSFDPEQRATYIKLAQGKVAKTISISDLVMVDVDEHDTPLGAEFIMRPERIISGHALDAVIDRYPAFKVLRESDAWLLAASE